MGFRGICPLSLKDSLHYGKHEIHMRYRTLDFKDLREIVSHAKSFCRRPIDNRAGMVLTGHLRPTFWFCERESEFLPVHRIS